MLIRYVVEVGCEPKRRFGRDGLLERLQRRDALRGRPSAPADERAEARQAEFQLRPLAFHCARCPANCVRDEFGCSGVIHCPISAQAETWLLRLLPPPRSLRDAVLREPEPPEVRRQMDHVRRLANRMEHLGIDGLAVDAHREDGLLLARSTPLVRQYGLLGRKTLVSSSQLLHLLLFRQAVPPAIGELACRALGAWVDGPKRPGRLPEAIFTQPVEERDPPGVAELKRFLLALMVARSLEVEVQTHVVAPEPHAEAERREPSVPLTR